MGRAAGLEAYRSPQIRWAVPNGVGGKTWSDDGARRLDVAGRSRWAAPALGHLKRGELGGDGRADRSATSGVSSRVDARQRHQALLGPVVCDVVDRRQYGVGEQRSLGLDGRR